MNFELLSQIQSPKDLENLTSKQLDQLATEIREALCSIVEDRAAHFASNLGVVELCIALHKVFDFTQDRLIWDTGHQIYPHKLITGRFDQFSTIRTRGGLMGYPNPNESEYDLFMTGHAGASVSTMVGLKTGDDLQGQDERRSVCVIGDGALPCGMVWEAMTNAVGMKKDVLVILNDNKMGICPRVGGLGEYLDKARLRPFYNGLKRDIAWMLNKVPVVGESVENMLAHFKESVKGFLHGGMLWEEMGFRYVGPVDGHDIQAMTRYLELLKNVKGPVLLHVLTEKGHGFQPACADPVKYHAPAPFSRTDDNEIVPIKAGKKKTPAYTNLASDAIYEVMKRDARACVLTAAMCTGNDLGKVRSEFPDRFFDTGITEGHAVAFAAGMAKTGMRPVVDIYSTFLQRSFDQIFQEVALQNLPVTFALDRAGLCGPDGPTHHGVFDNTYMRTFPNMVVMAPGDARDVAPMFDFAIRREGPTSLRYPKTSVEDVERNVAAIELGKAEIHRSGADGVLIAYGTLFPTCVKAADELRKHGLEVGVINARFAKPIDSEAILKAVSESGFVITIEESTICGGFGSAVLEACNENGVSTTNITRLGIPDRFMEHGERGELLASIGMDLNGIVAKSLELAGVKQDSDAVAVC